MTPTICDNCGASEQRERGAVLIAIDYPGGDYPGGGYRICRCSSSVYAGSIDRGCLALPS